MARPVDRRVEAEAMEDDGLPVAQEGPRHGVVETFRTSKNKEGVIVEGFEMIKRSQPVFVAKRGGLVQYWRCVEVNKGCGATGWSRHFSNIVTMTSGHDHESSPNALKVGQ